MKKLIIASILLSTGLAFGAYAGTVNVNTANAKTIAKELTGVGIAKAKAIVAYRKAHGPFKSLADLKAVKGIGDKTVDENKKNILFTDAKK
ncbi:MAG TPA: helix-hairpin-helix domain-containing protein [Gammaproteobacteria bacterium]|nr:helix-hairpin-helix domain-containing protein [Gammaproteobacteria bacterium]